jgi:glycyl-tRNA synthetase beta chain
MNADFLLELRCEEIPARMQARASEDLARLFAETLGQAGLKPGAITSYVTPRRLALIAHQLPLATQAVSEEFKGPRTSAPAQALDGFLRKTGLAQDQLEDRDGVWFATVEKPGRATADVLGEAIPQIVRAFPWPKSMRWGDASSSTESLRWVRPLQGIVALLGGDIVPMSIDGVTAGRETLGHRFHSSGAVPIASPEAYVEALRQAHVIVDPARRQEIIRAEATGLAAEAGLDLIPDDGLVAENAGLTEYPVPLLGRFDPAFLDVPPEVIQLTLRINQKYFVLRDTSGRLANAFICTANILPKDGGAAIVAGNGKVLAARLSDARFFWEQDKKTKLEVQAQKLSRITFHEKLGTVADKVERVAKLARWLVEEGIIKPSPLQGRGLGEGSASDGRPDLASSVDPLSPEGARERLADLAEQAARLCKADLVTEMVGEFPELQGLMGGYYARAEGLPGDVADAIRDHYKPVGQGDEVPTAPVTVAVSLADKLDSLTAFFAAGMFPTGSKDPFALRRSALGILGIVQSNALRLSLSAVVLASFELVRKTYLTTQMMTELAKVRGKDIKGNQEYLGQLIVSIMRGFNPERAITPLEIEAGEALVGQVLDFFADRLKVQQREAGVRHDLIDAVFALGGEDDLVRLLARVKALQAFVTTEDGANLLAGYKRAANILKKEGWEGAGVPAQASAADLGYTPEPAEAALITALDAAEPRAEAAIADEDFAAAMAALATLRGPIDAFFDKESGVMVNDADPAKRAARLNLLTRIRAAVHKVADFSKIEG